MKGKNSGRRQFVGQLRRGRSPGTTAVSIRPSRLKVSRRRGCPQGSRQRAARRSSTAAPTATPQATDKVHGHACRKAMHRQDEAECVSERP